MSIYIPTITSRPTRESSTCAGNAATKLFSSAQLQARAGIEIVNADSTVYLLVKGVARGAAAPTITTQDYDWMIAPNATLSLNYGSAMDVYVQNSTSAATTSKYIAYEVLT